MEKTIYQHESSYCATDLCNANRPNFNWSTPLNNINSCIRDRTCPQVLQHISCLKPSKFNIFAITGGNKMLAHNSFYLFLKKMHGRSTPTSILVIPHKWCFTVLEVGPWGSFCKVFKNMLGGNKLSETLYLLDTTGHYSWSRLTFTLSTQSMFRCSGIVVIHSP